MTTLIAFIVVIILLVLVHEFGHFWAAKRSGMRVDEFGIGFPPRIWSIKKGETLYSLNLLPFGGFVKIYGEDGELHEGDRGKSFAGSTPFKQIVTLLAGVSLNFLFAWVLISIGFMIGLLAPASSDSRVENPQLIVTTVFPGSPADVAGFASGDAITAVERSSGDTLFSPSPEDVGKLISSSHGESVEFVIVRGGEEIVLDVVPEIGLVETESYAVGIGMETMGVLQLPVHEALYEGGKTTIRVTHMIISGLGTFFVEIFQGTANTEQLTGPVGIAGLAGDAFRSGFVNFITFTALISLHLAVLNLLPIPALDGGRVLFVLIETISRKKIPQHVMSYVNAVAFVFLIGLMLFVTYKDVLRLF